MPSTAELLRTPYQVGITGGIGAGKSTVCTLFRLLGVPVYAADDRAKWLIENDLLLRSRIEALLGPEAYHPDGSYNRLYVAPRVFADAALLSQLNALVHPVVGQDYQEWVSRQGSSYVLKEAALMQAAGEGNTLDVVLVVEAPLDLRIRRLRMRDPHRSRSEIEGIMAKQATDEARSAWADGRILNDEKHPLIRQVLEWHQRFSSKIDVKS